MKRSLMRSACVACLLVASSAWAQAPEITSFYPASGVVGTRVTILGHHLATTATVTFSTTDVVFPVAPDFVSDEKVVATVPYNSSTGPFTVQTATGSITSAASFTVVPIVIGTATVAGPPAATGLATFSMLGGTHAVLYMNLVVTGGPANGVYFLDARAGSCGAPGFSEFGLGTLFLGASGSGSASYSTRLLSYQISPVFSSPHVLCGGSPGSCALCGDMVAAVSPEITSFGPDSGPTGTLVTIAGHDLQDASRVTFDGVPADFTVNSPSEISATVPVGANTGAIGVETPRGAAYSSTDFTPANPTALRRATWGSLKGRYR